MIVGQQRRYSPLMTHDHVSAGIALAVHSGNGLLAGEPTWLPTSGPQAGIAQTM
jgi:hypothetical protein